MIEVLSENDVASFVSEMSSGKLVSFAVAFWGRGACNCLGLVTASGGRIICNLESGCTNPDEILQLLGRFEVRTHAKLHSKLYKIDTMAVVGSSNASLNGLALEGEIQGWREINVATDDGDALSKLEGLFGELWNESTKVDKKTVEKFREAWCFRQRSRRPPDVENLLEAAKINPDWIINQPVSLIMYKEDLDKGVENEIDRKIKTRELVLPEKNGHHYYQDWKKFQPDSWFISIDMQKKPATIRIVRTFDRTFIAYGHNNEKVEILFERPKIVLGGREFSLSKGEKALIRKNADALFNSVEGDSGGRIVPIKNVIEIFKL